MGRSVRQKRKARSSRPVVRQTDERKRPVNPTGNVIIAQNWDKSLTLTQNYRHLGLMNRLRKPTGGVERLGTDAVSDLKAGKLQSKADRHDDPFQIVNAGFKKSAAGSVREVRVERDASGRIVRVLDEAAPAHNPLNDLLNELEDEEEEEEGTQESNTYEEWGGFENDRPAPKQKQHKTSKPNPVVEALEKMASQPVGPRHVHHQSAGERSWLQALVDHYGQADPDENMLAAMARDRRRNPFQRTANDLRRRLVAFRASGGAVTVA